MIVNTCILQIKKLSCGEITMCPQLTKPVTDVKTGRKPAVRDYSLHAYSMLEGLQKASFVSF